MLAIDDAIAILWSLKLSTTPPFILIKFLPYLILPPKLLINLTIATILSLSFKWSRSVPVNLEVPSQKQANTERTGAKSTLLLTLKLKAFNFSLEGLTTILFKFLLKIINTTKKF